MVFIAHIAPLQGRLKVAGRLVGAAIGALLLIALAGFIYQAAAEALDARAYPPPGVLVDVGGYRLHLVCQGAGSPTVVLESGLGDPWLAWSRVQPEVAQFTRVCSYDRAGYGWSDPGPPPRDPARLVEELHTLLERSGEPGPYLLVSHSMGGLPAQLYACQHPDEVAGLVLVDPTPSATDAEQLASLSPAERAEYSRLQTAYPAPLASAWPSRLELFAALAPFGAVRLAGGALLEQTYLDWLPTGEQPVYRALFYRTNYLRTYLAESAARDAGIAQARAAVLPKNLPLVVISQGVFANFFNQATPSRSNQLRTRMLQGAHRALARASSRGTHIVATESGHYVQFDQPALIIEAVRALVVDHRHGVQ